MADQQIDIEKLRKDGASDDQILNALGEAHGVDVGKLMKDGATKQQLIKSLSSVSESQRPGPPPAVGRGPGNFNLKEAEESSVGRFMGSAIEAMNPLPAIQSLGTKEGWKNLAAMVSPQLAAYNAYKKYKSGGSAAEIASEGFPGVGSQLIHGGQQMASGDVAGGVGTWAGTLAPFAFGEGAARLAEKVPFGKGAAMAYRSGLDFDAGTDLPTRNQVVNRGLGRPEPPGAPPGEPTVASEKGIAASSARETALVAEVDRRIADATTAGKTIWLHDILQPVKDLADFYRKDRPKYAKPVDNIIKDLYKRHGGDIQMTPQDIQEMKRILDDVLPKGAFKEGGKLGREVAGEKVRRGSARAELEKVADVKDLNWAAHLEEVLREAINKAIKNKPNLVDQLSPFVVGEAVRELLPGGSKLGSAMLVGALVRAGMRNPAAMTRLGIMLDKAGVAVPSTIRAGSFSEGLGTAVMVSQNRAENHPTGIASADTTAPGPPNTPTAALAASPGPPTSPNGTTGPPTASVAPQSPLGPPTRQSNLGQLDPAEVKDVANSIMAHTVAPTRPDQKPWNRVQVEVLDKSGNVIQSYHVEGRAFTADGISKALQINKGAAGIRVSNPDIPGNGKITKMFQGR